MSESNWKGTEVAPSGTHHQRRGEPIYSARFNQVLNFHDPGRAPVLDESGAYHITVDGRAAYEKRYLRTFGFYEGLAAVTSDAGWFHVTPQGDATYQERYAWCGNFQGGRCTVRMPDGAYLHLMLGGRPAYRDRWSYAGDFRDGVAVVQASDGLHSHIDENGELLHKRWFVDLDVFHKGFARARDERGWTHVDLDGKPRYESRFAAVEPFYNGQARVERPDGGLEVINEHGGVVRELRPARRSEFAALSGDMVGFWKTQTISAAVSLGVIEALPGQVADVADKCGLDRLLAGRLLRALGEMFLVTCHEKAWALTERGNCLRRGHPWTLADAALEYGGPMKDLWTSLTRALQSTGDWRPPYIFRQVAFDPPRVPGHHRMLQSYARHDYQSVPAALELNGDEVVIDAGGGLGVLAQRIIDHYPGTHVVLLDRPEVVDQITVPSRMEDRLAIRAENIFCDWATKGDAVVLARVVHDWDDSKAQKILQRARGALQPGGKIFLVEMLLSEEGFAGGLCDLHLLMATGGQERTVGMYRDLLEASGFDFKEVRTLPALPSVIVGVAR